MALYIRNNQESLQNQINYIDNSIKIEDFKKLSHKEKVEELIYILNKFISTFYDEISSDLVLLLLKEQKKFAKTNLKTTKVCKYAIHVLLKNAKISISYKLA